MRNILKELSNPLDIKDIDFRVQSINKGKYATILAYKDARVDMNRLDDVCGMFWQKKYDIIDGNLYCSVGIYSEELKQWIWRQDVGTESKTEKEKGQASDSFKRACFNWGIGRELYEYPIIQVKLKENELTADFKPTFDFKLKEWIWEVDSDNGVINKLKATDNNGVIRFNYSKNKQTATEADPDSKDNERYKPLIKNALNGKPKLEPSTTLWESVIKSIKNGKPSNIEAVHEYYDLSKENEVELLKYFK